MLCRNGKRPRRRRGNPLGQELTDWRQHDSESAKPWLERQLTTQPCHALAVFYLGQIARDGQDATEAAKYYRKSISCDADSPEAHLRLGMTLAEMNQNPEALRELTRAVELAPDNPAAHYRLALLYRKLGGDGRRHKAIACPTG
jgi:predicted Zn-dependent protease